MKKRAVRLTAVIVGLIVVIALGFAWFSWGHPDGAEQFARLFDIEPPAGVRNIVADRRYAGGPGDMLVLLRFQADRSAIEKILARRPFERDTTLVELYVVSANRIPTLWDRLFGEYAESGGEAWNAPNALVSPEIYEWKDPNAMVSVKLLWDAGTGETYVRYLLG